MDHKEILELLPAYLDQELGMSDAIAVERHLGTCTECQHELSEQRRISAMLKNDAAYYDAPTHLVERIRKTIPVIAPKTALQGLEF